MNSVSAKEMEIFNSCLAARDSAASATTRAYLHLVRPIEQFPVHSTEEIRAAWVKWNEADREVYRLTRCKPVDRTFPEPPPEGTQYKACRQMWGCLLMAQVERDEEFHGKFVREAVAEILASSCKHHPPSCPCKVPNNPWIYAECVQELAPLDIPHSPACRCGGYDGTRHSCKTEDPWGGRMKRGTMVYDAVMSRAAAENRVDAIALRIQAVNAVGAGLEAAKRGEPTPFLSLFRSRAPERTSEYDYTHKVETCPCGICHKARVDSGTDQAYTDSIRARVNAVTEKLTQEHKARMQ